MTATGGHNALAAAIAEERLSLAQPDAALRQREIEAATEDYLLASWPLIAIARGDKRAHLQAAWRRLAVANAERRLRRAGRLPAGRRGVALALHRAVLDLCRAYGLSGVDLVEAYNAYADAMETPPAGAEAIKALLALIIAEELDV